MKRNIKRRENEEGTERFDAEGEIVGEKPEAEKEAEG